MNKNIQRKTLDQRDQRSCHAVFLRLCLLKNQPTKKKKPTEYWMLKNTCDAKELSTNKVFFFMHLLTKSSQASFFFENLKGIS